MRAKEISPIHSTFSGAAMQRDYRNGFIFGQDDFSDMDEIRGLRDVGICGLDEYVSGMDAIQSGVTVASVGTPVQFLQGWLPGFVRVITAAQTADEILGITVIGDFADVQIVQGIVENTGVATPYNDLTNIPLSGYNTNFVYRDTVRFESGIRVGLLEEMQTAKMRLQAAAEKRESSVYYTLEVARNQIAFYGYNSGNNLTYGLLNDPQLPGYNTVATGAVSGSKLWSLKTPQEIITDILTGIQTLRTQSQDIINPERDPMTLALATDVRDYLSKITDFGISIMDWLKQTYPTIRVVSAPQFNNANGGANIFYLFADRVPDRSSDGGATFIQMVPAKFMMLGVQKLVKGFEEGYANCTAGVMCKRPYAVYRATGI